MKIIFNLYSRIAFLFSTIQVCHKRQENEKKRCGMLLLTVAFNDERLIEKQIEQIRLMIRDSDYQYVVADNSLNRKKREAIKEVCMQQGIDYIRIPYLMTLLFHYQIAVSHGAALNWIYYHYLREKRPMRFSLLDHDIFPVRDFNMTTTKELVRRCDIYHSDYVQIIDDAWLHLINGSNYANIKGKDDVIKEMLSDIVAFYNGFLMQN
jgi:hypothetical protein